MRRWIAIALLIGLFPSALHAEPREARIQLKDGRLRSEDFAAAVLEKMHIRGVSVDFGNIDLRGIRGSLFIQAMNASLGDGCRITLDRDMLVLHFDSEKLPRNFDQTRKAARVFTAVAAPEATAAQQRSYGLLLPRHVDPNKRVVVLIHGLDCNRSNWIPMSELLAEQGDQVAYFTYPSDGPLAESVELLTAEMTALHDRFPSLPVSILAHSMGGLVARAYVEGDQYAGGVRHLIMLGTPNQGSRWAAYRIALEIEEHCKLWRDDPDWQPSWMITDGLGEAGRDLKPRSAFLKSLNANDRRSGVAYTIVAGSQHPFYPMFANVLEGGAKMIPDQASHLWGFRQTEDALLRRAGKLRQHTGKSDGPVSVKETILAGVDDHVTLPSDHTALYHPLDGHLPAAWEIISDRLAR